MTIRTRAEAGTLSVAPDPHAASTIVTHTAGISEKLRTRLANRPVTLVQTFSVRRRLHRFSRNFIAGRR